MNDRWLIFVFILGGVIFGNACFANEYEEYEVLSAMYFLRLCDVVDSVEEEDRESVVRQGAFLAFRLFSSVESEETRSSNRVNGAIRYFYGHVRDVSQTYSEVFRDPMYWDHRSPNRVYPDHINFTDREAYLKKVEKFMAFLEEES